MTAFEQSEVAANEEQTPSYTILNAALRVVYHKTEATISANNLLDKQYLDHMSRFRAYDIVAPGLNISLNVTIPLDIR
jgi:iron complex outermembrane receptor protein